jgi:hypothetical protein
LREVGSFALRTGAVFGVAGVVMLWIAGRLFPEDHGAQRTMLLSLLILLGITALFRALSDGEAKLRGDRRFRMLGILAIPVYLTAMYWPLAASFFDLTPLGLLEWGVVLIVAAAAYGMCLVIDALFTPLAA